MSNDTIDQNVAKCEKRASADSIQCRRGLCRAENPVFARFCRRCGYRLAVAESDGVIERLTARMEIDRNVKRQEKWER